MAKIWSSLFGGGGDKEERLTQNDWASQWMTYQNNGYPLAGYGGNASSKVEDPPGDYEGYAEQFYKGDGVVFACMVARMNLFSEMRFQYQRLRGGRPGDLFGLSDLEIFEKPWPGGSTVNLLNKAIQHADVGGNHYVVREGRRLRILEPQFTDIILTAPPEEAVECDVAGWVFRPGGTDDRSKWKFYVAGQDKFAHWAPIPDPNAKFRGMSWLTPVVREVAADKSATLHKSKFFDNGATPSFAVSFKETVTAEQFKEFMAMMKETHQGAANAYKPLYLGGGADITPLMYDLRQLDFKATQGAGETRIAAAAQIHPVIVGLSEGMQGSSLNAGNFKAAKDAFGDRTLRPLWHSLCSSYANLVREPADSRLWYDDRDVSFLREDMLQRAQVIKEEANVLARLVQDGFTWDSSVKALREDGDWSLLKHTGLFSVQLQPPYPNGLPSATNAQGAPSGNPRPGTGRPATGAGSEKPGQTGTGAKPTPLQNKAKAAANKATAKPAPAKPTGAKRGSEEASPQEADSAREEGCACEAGCDPCGCAEEGRSCAEAEAGAETSRQEDGSEAPGEEASPEAEVADEPAEGEIDE